MPAKRMAKDWDDLCREMRSAQRMVMEAQEKISIAMRADHGGDAEAVSRAAANAYLNALAWRSDVDRRMRKVLALYAPFRPGGEED
jgi:hypothetical protein